MSDIAQSGERAPGAPLSGPWHSGGVAECCQCQVYEGKPEFGGVFSHMCCLLRPLLLQHCQAKTTSSGGVVSHLQSQKS